MSKLNSEEHPNGHFKSLHYFFKTFIFSEAVTLNSSSNALDKTYIGYIFIVESSLYTTQSEKKMRRNINFI